MLNRTRMTRYSVVSLFLLLTISLSAISQAEAKSPPKPEGSSKFDRNQIMLINLSHGDSSSSAYLQSSLESTRRTMKELDKALHQLEQVDKSYAKSRGRPDDSYLSIPAEEIKSAQKSAEELADQLKAASEDLKSAIQQALVREDNGKK